MLGTADAAEKKAAPAFFSIDSETTLRSLKTSAAGLSSKDAEHRLKHYGPNRPPEPAQRSALARFLSHFHHILIYVLIGAAIVTAILDHPIDTAVILAVVFANAIIGYVQEGRAERAMESIHQMLAPQAAVLRDGNRVGIDGEMVVPGDIVLLEPGDKVPADMRLVATHGLHIQEAILTGESVPVEKNTRPISPDAALGDQSCMAFSGTLATSGQGRGVVVATAPQQRSDVSAICCPRLKS